MSRGCEGPTEMVMSSAGVVSGPPCCATAIVAPLAAGHFSVYAADQPAPPTTVINFDAGKTRANNLLVSLRFRPVSGHSGRTGALHATFPAAA